MTDSPTDPLGNIPRYVIFRGKRARVLSYDEGRFTILDHLDTKRIVNRLQIKFIREGKK